MGITNLYESTQEFIASTQPTPKTALVTIIVAVVIHTSSYFVPVLLPQSAKRDFYQTEHIGQLVVHLLPGVRTCFAAQEIKNPPTTAPATAATPINRSGALYRMANAATNLPPATAPAPMVPKSG